MAKKQKRATFHIAMLGPEFERLKKFLDDDESVFLTFKDTTKYKGDNKESRVMIKTVFEKAGG